MNGANLFWRGRYLPTLASSRVVLVMVVCCEETFNIARPPPCLFFAGVNDRLSGPWLPCRFEAPPYLFGDKEERKRGVSHATVTGCQKVSDRSPAAQSPLANYFYTVYVSCRILRFLLSLSPRKPKRFGDSRRKVRHLLHPRFHMTPKRTQQFHSVRTTQVISL